MEAVASWVAPAATMIAAMMTAANLGARITGWGFVLFTLGSVAWSVVGIASGQANLVATNAFLTLVNMVGIWRWLGRQRAYEDGAESAAKASRRTAAPSLFTATDIAGLPVEDIDGKPVGKGVEALVECATGRISYVVIASGGVGGIQESLRALPRDRIHFQQDRLTIGMQRQAFLAQQPIGDGAWPAKAPQIATQEPTDSRKMERMFAPSIEQAGREGDGE